MWLSSFFGALLEGDPERKGGPRWLTFALFGATAAWALPLLWFRWVDPTGRNSETMAATVLLGLPFIALAGLLFVGSVLQLAFCPERRTDNAIAHVGVAIGLAFGAWHALSTY